MPIPRPPFYPNPGSYCPPAWTAGRLPTAAPDFQNISECVLGGWAEPRPRSVRLRAAGGQELRSWHEDTAWVGPSSPGKRGVVACRPLEATPCDSVSVALVFVGPGEEPLGGGGGNAPAPETLRPGCGRRRWGASVGAQEFRPAFLGSLEFVEVFEESSIWLS